MTFSAFMFIFAVSLKIILSNYCSTKESRI